MILHSHRATGQLYSSMAGQEHISRSFLSARWRHLFQGEELRTDFWPNPLVHPSLALATGNIGNVSVALGVAPPLTLGLD